MIPMSSSKPHSLIIGYGNVDRQDDGVAWHILHRLAVCMGRPTATETGGEFPPAPPFPDFLFIPQLGPEVAETLTRYSQACFVDAHTGAILKDIQLEPLQAGFQSSPFTHHMTPQTCLSIAQSLYGHAPLSVLVSVRGYLFNFSQELSPATSLLADQAVRLILDWLRNGNRE